MGGENDRTDTAGSAAVRHIGVDAVGVARAIRRAHRAGRGVDGERDDDAMACRHTRDGNRDAQRRSGGLALIGSDVLHERHGAQRRPLQDEEGHEAQEKTDYPSAPHAANHTAAVCDLAGHAEGRTATHVPCEV